MEELSELREFYDPDTVELMTWIRYTHIHPHSRIQSTHQIEANLISVFPQIKFHFAWCPWLVSVSVSVCVFVNTHMYCMYTCVSACVFAGEPGRWAMRADGCPWIRHGGAGKDPAVGRALSHLRVSVAGLSIKSISLMGSETKLWFGMAPYCGCCVCFCVCTSVCVCHFVAVRLDVERWTSRWLSSLFCISCNYATALSGQGHITSYHM